MPAPTDKHFAGLYEFLEREGLRPELLAKYTDAEKKNMLVLKRYIDEMIKRRME